MDPTLNPFAPGAGAPPPELAGREQILNDAIVALRRIKGGRTDRGHLLLGLRGVGKTVLLNLIGAHALKEGYLTTLFEAPEQHRLAELLTPRLRGILVKLSQRERAKELALRGLGALRSFASAFEVSIGGAEISVKPESGTADSGNLDIDLPELLVTVAEAAQAAGTGVAILIDEVQYLSEEELGALIVAMHTVSQKQLPMLLFGAGLPQLAGLAGDARSYAERLFRYPPVGPLPAPAASAAIENPLRSAGVKIVPEALARIVAETEGYPYFLQEWAYHTWNVALKSPITLDDVSQASADALQQLDTDFFKVRLDRLTPREKDYMRAMADLGPGPHRSGEIAERIGITVGQAGPLRNSLVKKGMIYSAEYGETAFTVPMFDAFMRRTMPRWSQPSKKAAKPPASRPKKGRR